jgi:H+/Cl- antiporter ClcA
VPRNYSRVAAGSSSASPNHVRPAITPPYNEIVLNLGKLIIILGAILVAIGLLFVLLARNQLPIGRLPGDIVYRRRNFTFYFPLATSILLSIVLSLVFYFLSRLRR